MSSEISDSVCISRHEPGNKWIDDVSSLVPGSASGSGAFVVCLTASRSLDVWCSVVNRWLDPSDILLPAENVSAFTWLPGRFDTLFCVTETGICLSYVFGWSAPADDSDSDTALPRESVNPDPPEPPFDLLSWSTASGVLRTAPPPPRVDPLPASPWRQPLPLIATRGVLLPSHSRVVATSAVPAGALAGFDDAAPRPHVLSVRVYGAALPAVPILPPLAPYAVAPLVGDAAPPASLIEVLASATPTTVAGAACAVAHAPHHVVVAIADRGRRHDATADPLTATQLGAAGAACASTHPADGPPQSAAAWPRAHPSALRGTLQPPPTGPGDRDGSSHTGGTRSALGGPVDDPAVPAWGPAVTAVHVLTLAAQPAVIAAIRSRAYARSGRGARRRIEHLPASRAASPTAPRAALRRGNGGGAPQWPASAPRAEITAVATLETVMVAAVVWDVGQGDSDKDDDDDDDDDHDGSRDRAPSVDSDQRAAAARGTGRGGAPRAIPLGDAFAGSGSDSEHPVHGRVRARRPPRLPPTRGVSLAMYDLATALPLATVDVTVLVAVAALRGASTVVAMTPAHGAHAGNDAAPVAVVGGAPHEAAQVLADAARCDRRSGSGFLPFQALRPVGLSVGMVHGDASAMVALTLQCGAVVSLGLDALLVPRTRADAARCTSPRCAPFVLVDSATIAAASAAAAAIASAAAVGAAALVAPAGRAGPPRGSEAADVDSTPADATTPSMEPAGAPSRDSAQRALHRAARDATAAATAAVGHAASAAAAGADGILPPHGVRAAPEAPALRGALVPATAMPTSRVVGGSGSAAHPLVARPPRVAAAVGRHTSCTALLAPPASRPSGPASDASRVRLARVTAGDPVVCDSSRAAGAAVGAAGVQGWQPRFLYVSDGARSGLSAQAVAAAAAAHLTLLPSSEGVSTVVYGDGGVVLSTSSADGTGPFHPTTARAPVPPSASPSAVLHSRAYPGTIHDLLGAHHAVISRLRAHHGAADGPSSRSASGAGAAAAAVRAAAVADAAYAAAVAALPAAQVAHPPLAGAVDADDALQLGVGVEDPAAPRAEQRGDGAPLSAAQNTAVAPDDAAGAWPRRLSAAPAADGDGSTAQWRALRRYAADGLGSAASLSATTSSPMAGWFAAAACGGGSGCATATASVGSARGRHQRARDAQLARALAQCPAPPYAPTTCCTGCPRMCVCRGSGAASLRTAAPWAPVAVLGALATCVCAPEGDTPVTCGACGACEFRFACVTGRCGPSHAVLRTALALSRGVAPAVVSVPSTRASPAATIVLPRLTHAVLVAGAGSAAPHAQRGAARAHHPRGDAGDDVPPVISVCDGGPDDRAARALGALLHGDGLARLAEGLAAARDTAPAVMFASGACLVLPNEHLHLPPVALHDSPGPGLVWLPPTSRRAARAVVVRDAPPRASLWLVPLSRCARPLPPRSIAAAVRRWGGPQVAATSPALPVVVAAVRGCEAVAIAHSGAHAALPFTSLRALLAFVIAHRSPAVADQLAQSNDRDAGQLRGRATELALAGDDYAALDAALRAVAAAAADALAGLAGAAPDGGRVWRHRLPEPLAALAACTHPAVLQCIAAATAVAARVAPTGALQAPAATVGVEPRPHAALAASFGAVHSSVAGRLPAVAIRRCARAGRAASVARPSAGASDDALSAAQHGATRGVSAPTGPLPRGGPLLAAGGHPYWARPAGRALAAAFVSWAAAATHGTRAQVRLALGRAARVMLLAIDAARAVDTAHEVRPEEAPLATPAAVARCALGAVAAATRVASDGSVAVSIPCARCGGDGGRVGELAAATCVAAVVTYAVHGVYMQPSAAPCLARHMLSEAPIAAAMRSLRLWAAAAASADAQAALLSKVADAARGPRPVGRDVPTCGSDAFGVAATCDVSAGQPRGPLRSFADAGAAATASALRAVGGVDPVLARFGRRAAGSLSHVTRDACSARDPSDLRASLEEDDGLSVDSNASTGTALCHDHEGGGHDEPSCDDSGAADEEDDCDTGDTSCGDDAYLDRSVTDISRWRLMVHASAPASGAQPPSSSRPALGQGDRITAVDAAATVSIVADVRDAVGVAHAAVERSRAMLRRGSAVDGAAPSVASRTETSRVVAAAIVSMFEDAPHDPRVSRADAHALSMLSVESVFAHRAAHERLIGRLIGAGHGSAAFAVAVAAAHTVSLIDAKGPALSGLARARAPDAYYLQRVAAAVAADAALQRDGNTMLAALACTSDSVVADAIALLRHTPHAAIREAVAAVPVVAAALDPHAAAAVVYLRALAAVAAWPPPKSAAVTPPPVGDADVAYNAVYAALSRCADARAAASGVEVLDPVVWWPPAAPGVRTRMVSAAIPPPVRPSLTPYVAPVWWPIGARDAPPAVPQRRRAMSSAALVRLRDTLRPSAVDSSDDATTRPAMAPTPVHPLPDTPVAETDESSVAPSSARSRRRLRNASAPLWRSLLGDVGGAARRSAPPSAVSASSMRSSRSDTTATSGRSGISSIARSGWGARRRTGGGSDESWTSAVSQRSVRTVTWGDAVSDDAIVAPRAARGTTRRQRSPSPERQAAAPAPARGDAEPPAAAADGNALVVEAGGARRGRDRDGARRRSKRDRDGADGKRRRRSRSLRTGSLPPASQEVVQAATMSPEVPVASPTAFAATAALPAVSAETVTATLTALVLRDTLPPSADATPVVRKTDANAPSAPGPASQVDESVVAQAVASGDAVPSTVPPRTDYSQDREGEASAAHPDPQVTVADALVAAASAAAPAPAAGGAAQAVLPVPAMPLTLRVYDVVSWSTTDRVRVAEAWVRAAGASLPSDLRTSVLRAAACTPLDPSPGGLCQDCVAPHESLSGAPVCDPQAHAAATTRRYLATLATAMDRSDAGGAYDAVHAVLQPLPFELRVRVAAAIDAIIALRCGLAADKPVRTRGRDPPGGAHTAATAYMSPSGDPSAPASAAQHDGVAPAASVIWAVAVAAATHGVIPLRLASLVTGCSAAAAPPPAVAVAPSVMTAIVDTPLFKSFFAHVGPAAPPLPAALAATGSVALCINDGPVGVVTIAAPWIGDGPAAPAASAGPAVVVLPVDSVVIEGTLAAAAFAVAALAAQHAGVSGAQQLDGALTEAVLAAVAGSDAIASLRGRAAHRGILKERSRLPGAAAVAAHAAFAPSRVPPSVVLRIGSAPTVTVAGVVLQTDADSAAAESDAPGSGRAAHVLAATALGMAAVCASRGPTTGLLASSVAALGPVVATMGAICGPTPAAVEWLGALRAPLVAAAVAATEAANGHHPGAPHAREAFGSDWSMFSRSLLLFATCCDADVTSMLRSLIVPSSQDVSAGAPADVRAAVELALRRPLHQTASAFSRFGALDSAVTLRAADEAGPFMTFVPTVAYDTILRVVMAVATSRSVGAGGRSLLFPVPSRHARAVFMSAHVPPAGATTLAAAARLVLGSHPSGVYSQILSRWQANQPRSSDPSPALLAPMVGNAKPRGLVLDELVSDVAIQGSARTLGAVDAVVVAVVAGHVPAAVAAARAVSADIEAGRFRVDGHAGPWCAAQGAPSGVVYRVRSSVSVALAAMWRAVDVPFTPGAAAAAAAVVAVLCGPRAGWLVGATLAMAVRVRVYRRHSAPSLASMRDTVACAWASAAGNMQPFPFGPATRADATAAVLMASSPPPACDAELTATLVAIVAASATALQIATWDALTSLSQPAPTGAHEDVARLWQHTDTYVVTAAIRAARESADIAAACIGDDPSEVSVYALSTQLCDVWLTACAAAAAVAAYRAAPRVAPSGSTTCRREAVGYSDSLPLVRAAASGSVAVFLTAAARTCASARTVAAAALVAFPQGPLRSSFLGWVAGMVLVQPGLISVPVMACSPMADYPTDSVPSASPRTAEAVVDALAAVHPTELAAMCAFAADAAAVRLAQRLVSTSGNAVASAFEVVFSSAAGSGMAADRAGVAVDLPVVSHSPAVLGPRVVGLRAVASVCRAECDDCPACSSATVAVVFVEPVIGGGSATVERCLPATAPCRCHGSGQLGAAVAVAAADSLVGPVAIAQSLSRPCGVAAAAVAADAAAASRASAHLTSAGTAVAASDSTGALHASLVRRLLDDAVALKSGALVCAAHALLGAQTVAYDDAVFIEVYMRSEAATDAAEYSCFGSVCVHVADDLSTSGPDSLVPQWVCDELATLRCALSHRQQAAVQATASAVALGNIKVVSDALRFFAPLSTSFALATALHALSVGDPVTALAATSSAPTVPCDAFQAAVCSHMVAAALFGGRVDTQLTLRTLSQMPVIKAVGSLASVLVAVGGAVAPLPPPRVARSTARSEPPADGDIGGLDQMLREACDSPSSSYFGLGAPSMTGLTAAIPAAGGGDCLAAVPTLSALLCDVVGAPSSAVLPTVTSLSATDATAVVLGRDGAAGCPAGGAVAIPWLLGSRPSATIAALMAAARFDRAAALADACRGAGYSWGGCFVEAIAIEVAWRGVSAATMPCLAARVEHAYSQLAGADVPPVLAAVVLLDATWQRLALDAVRGRAAPLGAGNGAVTLSLLRSSQRDDCLRARISALSTSGSPSFADVDVPIIFPRVSQPKMLRSGRDVWLGGANADGEASDASDASSHASPAGPTHAVVVSRDAICALMAAPLAPVSAAVDAAIAVLRGAAKATDGRIPTGSIPPLGDWLMALRACRAAVQDGAVADDVLRDALQCVVGAAAQQLRALATATHVVADAARSIPGDAPDGPSTSSASAASRAAHGEAMRAVCAAARAAGLSGPISSRARVHQLLAQSCVSAVGAAALLVPRLLRGGVCRSAATLARAMCPAVAPPPHLWGYPEVPLVVARDLAATAAPDLLHRQRYDQAPTVHSVAEATAPLPLVVHGDTVAALGAVVHDVAPYVLAQWPASGGGPAGGASALNALRGAFRGCDVRPRDAAVLDGVTRPRASSISAATAINQLHVPHVHLSSDAPAVVCGLVAGPPAPRAGHGVADSLAPATALGAATAALCAARALASHVLQPRSLRAALGWPVEVTPCRGVCGATTPSITTNYLDNASAPLRVACDAGADIWYDGRPHPVVVRWLILVYATPEQLARLSCGEQRPCVCGDDLSFETADSVATAARVLVAAASAHPVVRAACESAATAAEGLAETVPHGDGMRSSWHDAVLQTLRGAGGALSEHPSPEAVARAMAVVREREWLCGGQPDDDDVELSHEASSTVALALCMRELLSTCYIPLIVAGVAAADATASADTSLDLASARRDVTSTVAGWRTGHRPPGVPAATIDVFDDHFTGRAPAEDAHGSPPPDAGGSDGYIRPSDVRRERGCGIGQVQQEIISAAARLVAEMCPKSLSNATRRVAMLRHLGAAFAPLGRSMESSAVELAAYTDVLASSSVTALATAAGGATCERTTDASDHAACVANSWPPVHCDLHTAVNPHIGMREGGRVASRAGPAGMSPPLRAMSGCGRAAVARGYSMRDVLALSQLASLSDGRALHEPRSQHALVRFACGTAGGHVDDVSFASVFGSMDLGSPREEVSSLACALLTAAFALSDAAIAVCGCSTQPPAICRGWPHAAVEFAYVAMLVHALWAAAFDRLHTVRALATAALVRAADDAVARGNLPAAAVGFAALAQHAPADRALRDSVARYATITTPQLAATRIFPSTATAGRGHTWSAFGGSVQPNASRSDDPQLLMSFGEVIASVGRAVGVSRGPLGGGPGNATGPTPSVACVSGIGIGISVPLPQPGNERDLVGDLSGGMDVRAVPDSISLLTALFVCLPAGCAAGAALTDLAVVVVNDVLSICDVVSRPSWTTAASVDRALASVCEVALHFGRRRVVAATLSQRILLWEALWSSLTVGHAVKMPSSGGGGGGIALACGAALSIVETPGGAVVSDETSVAVIGQLLSLARLAVAHACDDLSTPGTARAVRLAALYALQGRLLSNISPQDSARPAIRYTSDDRVRGADLGGSLPPIAVNVVALTSHGAVVNACSRLVHARDALTVALAYGCEADVDTMWAPVCYAHVVLRGNSAFVQDVIAIVRPGVGIFAAMLAEHPLPNGSARNAHELGLLQRIREAVTRHCVHEDERDSLLADFAAVHDM